MPRSHTRLLLLHVHDAPSSTPHATSCLAADVLLSRLLLPPPLLLCGWQLSASPQRIPTPTTWTSTARTLRTRHSWRTLWPRDRTRRLKRHGSCQRASMGVSCCRCSAQSRLAIEELSAHWPACWLICRSELRPSSRWPRRARAHDHQSWRSPSDTCAACVCCGARRAQRYRSAAQTTCWSRWPTRARPCST